MRLGVVNEHLLRVGVCRHLQRIIQRRRVLGAVAHRIEHNHHTTHLRANTCGSRVAVLPTARIVEATASIVEELVVLSLRREQCDILNVVPLTHDVGGGNTLSLQYFGHTGKYALSLLGNTILKRRIDSRRQHLVANTNVILASYNACRLALLNKSNLGCQRVTQWRLRDVADHRSTLAKCSKAMLLEYRTLVYILFIIVWCTEHYDADNLIFVLSNGGKQLIEGLLKSHRLRTVNIKNLSCHLSFTTNLQIQPMPQHPYAISCHQCRACAHKTHPPSWQHVHQRGRAPYATPRAE